MTLHYCRHASNAIQNAENAPGQAVHLAMSACIIDKVAWVARVFPIVQLTITLINIAVSVSYVIPSAYSAVAKHLQTA